MSQAQIATEDFEGTETGWNYYFTHFQWRPYYTTNAGNAYNGSECAYVYKSGGTGLPGGIKKTFNLPIEPKMIYFAVKSSTGSNADVWIKVSGGGNEYKAYYMRAAGLDPWHQIVFQPLNSLGKDIVIDIGCGTGGSNCEIWVDDIQFLPNKMDYDLSSSQIVNPSSSFCGMQNESIGIKILNMGEKSIPPGDTITMCYQVNKGDTVCENLILSDSFKYESDTICNFQTLYDFFKPGIYDMQCWIKYRKDTFLLNNSCLYYIENSLIDTFPYVEDCDGSVDFYGYSWQNSNWTLSKGGGTSTSNTGPDDDHSTSGYLYYYLEASTTSKRNPELTSPCLYLSDMKFPYLEFWYHMYGKDIDHLAVEVDANGNTQEVFRLEGEQQSSGTNWKKASVDLYEYLDTTFIKLRILGSSNGGYGDIAIDDIKVFDKCDEASGTKPSVDFILSDTVYTNAPFTIINSFPASYPSYSSWFLNDSFVSSSYDLEDFVISALGTDTIKLVIETCWGIDTIIKTVEVHKLTSSPISNFTVSQNMINTSETVQFYDLSEKGASNWKWIISPATDFNNNPLFSFVNGDTSRNPSVTFHQSGNYKVCLVSSNVLGSDTLCRDNYIKVKDKFELCKDQRSSSQNGDLFDIGGSEGNYSDNEYCSFLINPCANEVDLTFKEFNLAKGDYLRMYDGVDNTGQKLWDTVKYGINGMGNGLDINDPGFDESFTAKSGSIFIEFVSDSSLNSSGFHAEWMSNYISLSNPLNPDFTLVDSICMSDTAFFTNTTLFDNNSYSEFHWDLNGDGTYDTVGQNANFIYSNTGTYSIKLTAVNCGGAATITKNITVIPPWHRIAVNFEADNDQPVMSSDVVKLKSTSYGCIDYYEWAITPSSYTIEEGSLFSSDPEISIIFEDTVCYDIELTIYSSSYLYSAKKTCFIKPYSYCVPVVKNLSSDIGISKVKFNNIYQISGSGTNDYTDFSQGNQTEIERGSTYTVSIYRESTNNEMNRKVWIDYNQDGDFTDSLELVAYETAAKTKHWDAMFKVPGDALSGTTRMRIGVSYGNMDNEPCGVNYFGEFEDYKLVILPDQSGPVITLNGPDTVNLEQCHPYVEAGAIAIDNVEGNISSGITITGNVDPAVLGNYLIGYGISDSSGNIADTIYRTVIVTLDATPPQITLNGQAAYDILVNHPFVDLLYTALDSCTGIDTVIVNSNLDTSLVGEYEITYTAYDKAGNMAKVSRYVSVIDTVKPEISCSAGTTIEMDVHTLLAEPVLSITDNYYTTFDIKTSGSYYENFKNGFASDIGQYTLIYEVTDGSGNSNIITFDVIVYDRIAPEIELIGKTWIELCRFDTLDPGEDSIIVTDNYDPSPILNKKGDYITNYLVYKDEGNYELVYEVSDQSGNTSRAYRYVYVTDCHSGIENQDIGNAVQIYPNPNKGRFTVELGRAIQEDAVIRIIDNLGKIVENVKITSSNTQIAINITGVASGIYILELNEGKQVERIKFCVHK